MAPLVKALENRVELDVQTCVTGQHREMLDPVLDFFSIKPAFDLDIMSPGQTLPNLTSALLKGVSQVLTSAQPDLVLVHGDTSTTLSASLACYYQRLQVGHVEAGLRTGDIFSPWPEELNRRVTSIIANMHFAPTARARDNLIKEGVLPENIFVTGNTVIDALLHTVEKMKQSPRACAQYKEQFKFIDPSKKIVLVTGHRRENFGTGFEDICYALSELAKRPDVEIVYPVHLNPSVRKPVHSLLRGISTVHLIEPLDYFPFVYLMTQSYIILTDSGGIQEEAPSLGKPVLVMRETTERPEAVDAGTVILVSTDKNRIVTEAQRLLDDPAFYRKMASCHNPYGDGRASERIFEAILTRFKNQN